MSAALRVTCHYKFLIVECVVAKELLPSVLRMLLMQILQHFNKTIHNAIRGVDIYQRAHIISKNNFLVIIGEAIYIIAILAVEGRDGVGIIKIDDMVPETGSRFRESLILAGCGVRSAKEDYK